MGNTVYFANGTTALAAAVAATTRPGSLVAVPAAICPAVPAAVLAVGRRPYFVDIEADTLGLCPNRLADVIGSVDAVVAAHVFGIPCNIADIARICADVPLIEDCAQAEGAETPAGPVGSTGAVAIFSFGPGKMVKVGCGGAASTQNTALADQMRSFAAPLGPCDPSFATDLSRTHKFLYNSFYPDRAARYPFILAGMLETCGRGALGRAPDDLEDKVIAARKRLPESRAERHRKAALYRSLLAHRCDITAFASIQGAIPAYYNILLAPPVRDRVLRRFIAEGRAISSWNADLTRFLGQTFPSTTVNISRQMDAHILNLWLDDPVTDADIKSTVSTLLVEIDAAA